MSAPLPRALMWFRVTPLSPLLLGDRSGVGAFQESVDHIPGSMLRGAVAERLLQRSAADFAALFDDRAEPFFGPAYLGPVAPTWPFPLTTRTCKRYPGLSTGTTSDRRRHHGVADALLADLAYDLVSDADFPQRATLQPDLPADWYDLDLLPPVRAGLDVCPVCGEPREPLKSGYYAWSAQPLQAAEGRRRRMTHVGINRARAVAQDQLLFTQERLHTEGAGQSFFGAVSVPETKTAQLEESLAGEHFIGRGRTRGNGRIYIEVERHITLPSLADRLFDFNLAAAVALRPYRQADERVRPQLPGRLFSLTLSSPAILHAAGAPLSAPPPAALGLRNDVQLLRAWARPAQVGGWDSAAGLPRRTLPAVQAGSVFLYWAAGEELDSLEEALGRLERAGIGAERERGYGQLVVCAPFHTIQE